MPLYLVRARVQIDSFEPYRPASFNEYRLIEASTSLNAVDLFEDIVAPQIRALHYGAWVDNIVALETIRENT